MTKSFVQNPIPWLLAFFAAAVSGLYFRTYPLHHALTPRADKVVASYLVEKMIIEQIRKTLDQTMPGASVDDKLKVAREQARRAIESDRKQYEDSVKAAEIKLRNVMPQQSNRRYLLEADPYYYFY